VQWFHLTNLGRSTCRLGGYPALYGITPGGKHEAIAVGHGTFFGNLVAVDLPPGARGEFIIGGNDMCVGVPPGEVIPRPITYRVLLVELPDHEGSFVTRRFPPCGPLDVSELGTEPPSAVIPTPRPGTLESLQAAVTLPQGVYGGRLLSYVVTLTNPTRTPVALTPCPGYTEFLTLVEGMKVHLFARAYQLNCRSVQRLAGGASVRFAMRLEIPAVSQATPAKFGWGLDVGDNEFALNGVDLLVGSALTVEPAPSS